MLHRQRREFFLGRESRGLEGAWAQLARGWQQKYEQEKENGREERERSSNYYTLWSHQIKTPVAAMHLLLQEEELDRRSMEQELWKAEQYVMWPSSTSAWIRTEGIWS